MKKLDKKLYKCFEKVGFKKEKTNEKQEELYNKWKSLKKKTDMASRAEMEEIEEELAEEYMNKVKSASNKMDCAEGGKISNELWKLKKHMCPHSREPPIAMSDEEGNLVTNATKLKDMAIKAYQERLRNRPIKEGMEEIKDAKENLAENLMEEAKLNKTDPWTLSDLDNVLQRLKKNKSRDPNGLANEIFKPDVAGSDLKLAILKLMNRIRKS